MVTKTQRQKAEDCFRDIEFPGTELRLGEAPKKRRSKKLTRGEEGFGAITFPGTEGMLGPAPKRGRKLG